jgi:ubiquinol-cytochrome c reductase cytochrome c subunit
MRRIALIVAIVLGALGLVMVARAATPGGVVRPENEARTPLLQLGRELFAGNCASCHGSLGGGVSLRDAQRGGGAIQGAGPSLRGVGALSADFYLRTGRMPLGHVGEAPKRQRSPFNPREISALTAYVASLGNGPAIPHPNPAGANLARGLTLFTQHCAGCHQVVAEGGYVTDTAVPTLKHVTSTQIAEAVRVGPYLMPSFPRSQISDRQLNAIIAYVQASKHPDDRGGWGIGHIGPVPEGMIAWFVAGFVLVGVCVIIGERLRA